MQDADVDGVEGAGEVLGGVFTESRLLGQADVRGPRGRGPGASARPDAVTVQANAAATASAAANPALSSSSFTGVGQDDSFTTTTPRSTSM